MAPASFFRFDDDAGTERRIIPAVGERSLTGFLDGNTGFNRFDGVHGLGWANGSQLGVFAAGHNS